MSNNKIPDLDHCHASGIPILGMMGLAGSWEPSAITDVNREAAVHAIQTALDSGYTCFDHADMYAFGYCESIFRHCMEVIKPDRSKLYIASKCSIRDDHII